MVVVGFLAGVVFVDCWHNGLSVVVDCGWMGHGIKRETRPGGLGVI